MSDIKKDRRKSRNMISVVGAREHNLKNISVDIPKESLTVITGPSGSGKSSLAMDILYTEGRRRYVESLSSYARQFLGVAKKPEFDRIEGLCPSVAIDQKTVGSNPRSTVGTITEIYDYLRVLFARIGQPHCPDCKTPLTMQEPDVLTQRLFDRFAGASITLSAPLVRERKGEFTNDLTALFHKGFSRFVIDGVTHRFRSEAEIKQLKLQKTKRHTIDIVIDRFTLTDSERARLQESITTAFTHAHGLCAIAVEDQRYTFARDRSCVDCSYAIGEIEPRLFSFNSPVGACTDCGGLGMQHEWPWESGDAESWKEKYQFFADRYARQVECRSCKGMRLNTEALHVLLDGKNIWQTCQMSIPETRTFVQALELTPKQQEIAQALIQEVTSRLRFLEDVGLTYLTLNRTARTLSGGEGQRIRLATQIGSALSGVLYILDEPSIGLHQRDNDRLIQTLAFLRDQGNTVVVVEHDLDTIATADHVIDMGPQAGTLGGHVTAAGTPQQLKKDKHSLTGAYLAGRKMIAVPDERRAPSSWLRVSKVNTHNLQNVTAHIPLGVMCGVSGVSGSGKSSLIMHSLVPMLRRRLNRNLDDSDMHGILKGADALEHLVVIDQSPIGRTPRSNPATYLGIFGPIRTLYASLPESNMRGYTPGQFSFNVDKGRCSECRGDGTVTVSMHFLPDVNMVCKMCNGARYSAQTLEITYKGKNIAQILDMTALEAVEFFKAHAPIAKRLRLLCSVGLDYLKLGQSSTTLSGGEAQRIKLVNELAKRGKNTLYILDEPTTGLHTHDIQKLLTVLNRLVDKGNSMIIIEHNIDVLKTMDHLIDIGPEGGDGGGAIVAAGTPEKLAQAPQSHTGRYLAQALDLKTA